MIDDSGEKKINERLEQLENRVRDLETIINCSAPHKPGRKSKLTQQQKLEIIEKRSRGETCERLADEYDVSKSTISSICNQHPKKEISIPVQF